MCYDGFVKSARFPGAPRTMRPRDAVLLTPSESSGLSRLRSYILSTPVTPLDSTLTDLSASVANKRLTESLNPLNATLTKNMAGGGAASHSGTRPSPFVTRHCTQVLSFHTVTNSFATTEISTLLFSNNSKFFCQNTRGGVLPSTSPA